MVRLCRHMMVLLAQSVILSFFLLAERAPDLAREVVVLAESSFDSGQDARPGVEVSFGFSECDVKVLALRAWVSD